MRKLIGAAIKALREKKGYSQYRLDQLSGVNQQHISRIEAGERLPGIGVLLELARALGTTPDGVLIEAGLLEGDPRELVAIDVYQVTSQLSSGERKWVRDFAHWRLAEDKARYKTDNDG